MRAVEKSETSIMQILNGDPAAGIFTITQEEGKTTCKIIQFNKKQGKLNMIDFAVNIESHSRAQLVINKLQEIYLRGGRALYQI